MKKYCNDYIQTTNDGCLYITNKNICFLNYRFKCPIIQKRKYKEEDYTNTYSVSKINTYMKCPRLYYFNYILKYKLPEDDLIDLIMGSIFSDIRPRIEMRIKWSLDYYLNKYKDNNEFLIELKKLNASLIKYENYVKSIEYRTNENENEVFSEFELYLDDFDEKIKIICYADSIKNTTIWEWKYTSNENYYNRMTTAQQISIYLMAFPEVNEVKIGIIKKPNRNENANIKIITFLRDEYDLLYEAAMLKEIIKKIKNDNEYYPNYTNCHQCKFVDFCKRNPYLKPDFNTIADITKFNDLIEKIKKDKKFND